MRELFYVRLADSGTNIVDQDGNVIGDSGQVSILDAFTGEWPLDDKGDRLMFVEINTLGDWSFVIDQEASESQSEIVTKKIHGKWRVYLA
jgi:hypothetical protein